MITYKTTNEFLLNLDESKRKQVETLRNIIRDVEPDLKEHIKWNSPSYVFNEEDRITFSVREGFPVLLILHMGAIKKEDKNAKPILDDPNDLIEWKSDTRGVISFSNLDDIERKKTLLVDIIKRWLSI